MEVRWPEQVVRVVTESIALEGVQLGPFAVEFSWAPGRCFRGVRSFEVIALEPNPAAGRDEVVHPHVDGRRLCPGDAAEPTRLALDAGRLADAFLLVRSVLTTYNADSPFVPLAAWDGFHCGDCGRHGHEMDRSSCSGCSTDLCDDCAGSCNRCSESHCTDCLLACAVCDERRCRGCLVTTPSERLVCPDCRAECTACGRRFAADELTDGLCSACTAAAEDEAAEPLTENAHVP